MRARLTNGRLLPAAGLALALGGCALTEADLDGTFSVVIAGEEHVDPLVVDVVDQTGTVTAVLGAEGPFMVEIVAPPADPAMLVVTWVGGMCDVRARLTVAPTLDSMRISERTDTRLGACEAAGVLRSIAIRFDPPLPVDFAAMG